MQSSKTESNLWGRLAVGPYRSCLCPSVSVFVVSPGTGGSGHSSGYQVRRQHPQGLCYIAVHHPVNTYIILLAPGLRPHWVQETIKIRSIFFLIITISPAECCLVFHRVFFFGAILVIVATFLYGYEGKPPPNPSRA